MPLQLDENVKALGSRAQAQLTEQFARIDAIAQENTARVLAAFQEHRVAESYFSGTTGFSLPKSAFSSETITPRAPPAKRTGV